MEEGAQGSFGSLAVPTRTPPLLVERPAVLAGTSQALTLEGANDTVTTMIGEFQTLTRAYAVSGPDRLMPIISAYRLGAVAVVLSSRREGEQLIAANASGWIDEPRLVEVGDPLNFMRQAAAEGLCGFAVVNASGELQAQYVFMTRVEEAGRHLPTVLTRLEGSGPGPSLVRSGVRRFEHSDLRHWSRFDILDPVAARFGLFVPFRGWDHGDALFEVRSGNAIVLLADVPLLGHWNSPEGAVAFFTSRELAAEFIHDYLPRTRVALLYPPDAPAPRVVDRPDVPDAPRSPKPVLRIESVPDLARRVLALRDIIPLAAFAVNPTGHRESSGYGRIDFAGPHPVVVGGLAGDGIPRMAGVSGIWKILPGNVFERESPLDRWVGGDTINWSGGQAVQLVSLSRSFADQRATLDWLSNAPGAMSDTELEDEFLAKFARASYRVLCENYEPAEDLLEAFHVVAWDCITGEGADGSLAFRSFTEAAQYMAAYERDHDRPHRVTGAYRPGHLGVQGSHDQEHETARGEPFQTGVRRLATRAARRGYVPSDANDLVTLCTGTLATLHVEYAGYAKDLLWTCSDEDRTRILDTVGVAEAAWSAWSNAANAPVDPTGAAMAEARMGRAWNDLDARAQHFISTALVLLEDFGHAPQLDYAPISIEIVKALEWELVLIFAAFVRTLGGVVPAHMSNARHENELAAFAKGSFPPTLGAMARLLRSVANGSPLQLALVEYLESLPNYAFLVSDEFAVKALKTATKTYRNGGAHSSRIEEAVCRRCIDDVVGLPDRLGWISRVAEWKRRAVIASPAADLGGGGGMGPLTT